MLSQSQRAKLLKAVSAANKELASDNEAESLVGLRVVRWFKGYGDYWGNISGTQPAPNSNKWYRVSYDDGDCEDYNIKDICDMAENALFSKRAEDPKGSTTTELAMRVQLSHYEALLKEMERKGHEIPERALLPLLSTKSTDSSSSSASTIINRKLPTHSSTSSSISPKSSGANLATSATVATTTTTNTSSRRAAYFEADSIEERAGDVGKSVSSLPSALASKEGRLLLMENTGVPIKYSSYDLRKCKVALLNMGFAEKAVHAAMLKFGGDHDKCVDHLLENVDENSSDVGDADENIEDRNEQQQESGRTSIDNLADHESTSSTKKSKKGKCEVDGCLKGKYARNRCNVHWEELVGRRPVPTASPASPNKTSGTEEQQQESRETSKESLNLIDPERTSSTKKSKKGKCEVDGCPKGKYARNRCHVHWEELVGRRPVPTASPASPNKSSGTEEQQQESRETSKESLNLIDPERTSSTKKTKKGKCEVDGCPKGKYARNRCHVHWEELVGRRPVPTASPASLIELFPCHMCQSQTLPTKLIVCDGEECGVESCLACANLIKLPKDEDPWFCVNCKKGFLAHVNGATSVDNSALHQSLISPPTSINESKEEDPLDLKELYYPCHVCQSKTLSTKLLLCDGCSVESCLACANLIKLPEDEEPWICVNCQKTFHKKLVTVNEFGAGSVDSSISPPSTSMVSQQGPILNNLEIPKNTSNVSTSQEAVNKDKEEGLVPVPISPSAHKATSSESEENQKKMTVLKKKKSLEKTPKKKKATVVSEDEPPIPPSSEKKKEAKEEINVKNLDDLDFEDFDWELNHPQDQKEAEESDSDIDDFQVEEKTSSMVIPKKNKSSEFVKKSNESYSIDSEKQLLLATLPSNVKKKMDELSGLGWLDINSIETDVLTKLALTEETEVLELLVRVAGAVPNLKVEKDQIAGNCSIILNKLAITFFEAKGAVSLVPKVSQSQSRVDNRGERRGDSVDSSRSGKGHKTSSERRYEETTGVRDWDRGGERRDGRRDRSRENKEETRDRSRDKGEGRSRDRSRDGEGRRDSRDRSRDGRESTRRDDHSDDRGITAYEGKGKQSHFINHGKRTREGGSVHSQDGRSAKKQGIQSTSQWSKTDNIVYVNTQERSDGPAHHSVTASIAGVVPNPSATPSTPTPTALVDPARAARVKNVIVMLKQMPPRSSNDIANQLRLQEVLKSLKSGGSA